MKLLLGLSEPVSEFGRKCFALDSSSLATAFELTVSYGTLTDDSIRAADFVQVYGHITRALLRKTVGRLVVADPSADVHSGPWFAPPPPKARVEIAGRGSVPEAVAPDYFLKKKAEPRDGATRVVGVFRGKRDLQTMIDLTATRLARVREDIDWRFFDDAPTPEEIASCDVWCDPAISQRDLDGFTAEAAVSGIPVVATRTAINEWRLERGLAGLLAPPSDPNELSHAILAALFKPELTASRTEHAWQSRDRFAVGRRVEGWISFYRNLPA